MARRIRYNPRGFAHIYQRGYRMSVLFYSVKDILVFYTILYTLKEKYRITIVGLVCMFNHYHILLKADSQEKVSRFMCESETTYSREFNRESGTKGPLFSPAYGLSNKIGDKKKRDACAYLYNNPGEKGLTDRAETYRWNFMPYAKSDHSFSRKLIVRKSSREMKKVLNEVKYLFENGRYIPYTFLRRWFSVLATDEINQLIDHIIVKYKVVDYEESIRLYGTYEKMVIAINSNAGSEHDIHEDRSEKSYVPYIDAIRLLSMEYGFKDPKKVLSLEINERRKMSASMIRMHHTPRFIAETVLHIYLPEAKRADGKAQ